MDVIEDQQVINRVLRGDVDAFGTLVHRYQRPIFNLMYRVAGTSEDAADLTQETFAKTYQNLERFKPGKRFFPWLYSIGLNVARDFGRKNKLNPETKAVNELENLTTYHSPEADQDNLIAGLDFLTLEKTLRSLPIAYREALVLRYHEELPMRDVAEALDISLSAAKMRVKRGLEMLRQSFKEGHKV